MFKTMLVTGKNVGLYPVNMMGPDHPGEDLGTPAELLQPGDRVQVEGVAANTPYGVSYTPVTVMSRPGLYWVRTQYLGEMRELPEAAYSGVPVPTFPRDTPAPGFFDRLTWWQIGLLALGTGLAGYSVYKATTAPKARHA